jgi:hypothetical protein
MEPLRKDERQHLDAGLHAARGDEPAAAKRRIVGDGQILDRDASRQHGQ